MAEHDMQVRTNQTIKFLTKGHKVKIEMRLRGRERAYPNQGREIISGFIGKLGLPVIVEQPTLIQGNTITTLIAKK
jgi:translation initiation factor IF-3